MKYKYPFYLNGKFYDFESGQEFFNPRVFAGPFQGLCYVGFNIFETWIDGNGERNWIIAC